MGGDGLARPPNGRGGLAGPSGLIPVGLANLHTRAKVGKRLNLVHSINSTPLHSTHAEILQQLYVVEQDS